MNFFAPDLSHIRYLSFTPFLFMLLHVIHFLWVKLLFSCEKVSTSRDLQLRFCSDDDSTFVVSSGEACEACELTHTWP